MSIDVLFNYFLRFLFGYPKNVLEFISIKHYMHMGHGKWAKRIIIALK
jgi:hypothetical protein